VFSTIHPADVLAYKRIKPDPKKETIEAIEITKRLNGFFFVSEVFAVS
jgi:hypothetical protein